MELRVHLKICEGCGCLWYRAQVETGVYCTACRERFKQFPTPTSRKRRGRPGKTILPTVFAVEATREMIFEEREGFQSSFRPEFRAMQGGAGGTGLLSQGGAQ
ncbi:MAG TPA: hypothetical protein VHZ52_05300 [Acidobacteriaceae bacterium]|jgi:hypothetical protein|nr:hypothetical protein [Acidobacteriaceae bacterium]